MEAPITALMTTAAVCLSSLFRLLPFSFLLSFSFPFFLPVLLLLSLRAQTRGMERWEDRAAEGE